jgi:hypothetical protein
MRQSKRFFGICLCFLSLLTAGSNTICAQQEIMSYDLSDSWYSRELNPAFFPADRKVHLGLACVGADVWTDTGLDLQDFRKMFGGGLTEEAYQAYLFRLKERSQVAMDVRTEALSLGFNIRGGFFFSAMHSFRLHTVTEVPVELPQLILLGNDNVIFWNNEVNVAPRVKGLGWQEVRLALSKKTGGFSFGAGVNILLGTSCVETLPDYSSMTLFTDPSNLLLVTRNNYRFHSANALESFDFQNLEPGFTTVEPESVNPFSNALIAGRGIGIDAGFNWKLNKFIMLSGSVLDFGGRINWDKNAYLFSADNEFVYDGGAIASEALLTGVDALELSAQKLEEMNQSLTFQRTNESFSTIIPARYYGKITFLLSGSLALHGTYFHQESSGLSQNSLGIGLRFKPVRWFSLGVMSIRGSNKQSVLGANLTLMPGPVQIFAACDNINSLIDTERITRGNFRAGLSLAFGKVTAGEKKEAFEKKEDSRFWP